MRAERDLKSEHWRSLFEADRLGVLVQDSDGAHDVSHLQRTWKNAQAVHVGEGRKADVQIIRAAVFLHDLVSLPKDDQHRSSASRRSADLAVQLLGQHGFPRDKLDAVHHAIVAHSYSANVRPETTEARIVQDADRLDALGAVGLARAFFVAGTINQALFPTGPALQCHTRSDHTTIDHIHGKLFLIPQHMHTATGRHIALTRLKVMYRYLSELTCELDAVDQFYIDIPQEV